MAYNAAVVVHCGAIRDNGKPCKMAVKPGFTRCYMHGAATPTAKVKAEHMLALLRTPAMEVLHNSMETINAVIDQFNDDACPTCGYPRGDVEEKEALIKACRTAAQTCAAVLDRTGLGPRSTVDVRSGEDDLDLKSLTDDERARMILLLTQLRDLKVEIRKRIVGEYDPMLTTQTTTSPTVN